MGYRDCAVMALVCAAMAQSGCASKLDFDRVSAGKHSVDAGGTDAASAADAASAVGTLPMDAASAFDANSPRPNVPHDADDGRADLPSATSLADGGVATDSALPDSSVTYDPATFSCAEVSPEPDFCDDFESSALGSHWDYVQVDPTSPVGGSIEIDNGAARSGKNSLLVQINQGLSVCDNCIDAFAGLYLFDLQKPVLLAVEFDVRVEQVDPNVSRRIVLAQLSFGTTELGFTQHTLQLESRGNESVRAGIIEFDTPGQPPSSTAAPSSDTFVHDFSPVASLAEWVHVTYLLDVTEPRGTANTLAVWVDDFVVFYGAPQFALRNTNLRLELGVPWVVMSTATFGAQDTSQRWRLRFDNVLVRSESR